MRTRRQFLGDSTLSLAALSGLGAAPASAETPVKSKPDVLVYDGTYPGWPWVAAGSGGTLYCVFREGTVHGYSGVGRAMLVKSVDKGKTWSEASVIIDYPFVDDRNVAITELGSGDLLVTYNVYMSDKKCEAMTIRSRDGGDTWLAPQSAGVPDTRTRGAAVQLRSGAVLFPLYSASRKGAIAGRSEDGGTTWTHAFVPNSDGFVGDEWSVLEVEAGHLVGVSRNHHPQPDANFYVTESQDDGKTWSPGRKTNVHTVRPCPAQITKHNGAPMLVYADHRMVSVAAATTKDPAFVEWDVDHRLRCYQYMEDGSRIPDTGYPCSVAVGPNTRLVVDYEIRPDSKRIAGYFVEFPGDWGK
jgi:hypothetical protein